MRYDSVYSTTNSFFIDALLQPALSAIFSLQNRIVFFSIKLTSANKQDELGGLDAE